MIIDAHAHVFAPVSAVFPRDTHEMYPAEAAAPVEDYLALMDASGVSRAVLVALSAHDEYLAHCVSTYPDRLAAVGIQPAESFSVADYLRRRTTIALQGLRLFGLGDPGIDDPEQLQSFPLLRQMAEEGTKLWFYSSEAQLRLLDRVLHKLPSLVVVLNHLGFCPGELEIDEHGRPHFRSKLPPPSLQTALALARHPNVYVLFSGHYAFSAEPFPYRDLREVCLRLVDAFGPERLMFGSDYPWIREAPGYPSVLSLVDEHLAQLTAQERAGVLGANAGRLFTFRAPSEAG